MSRPLTPTEVEDAIGRILERQDRALELLKEAAMGAADAEATYRTHFSQARLEYRALKASEGVKVTADEVEDWARVDTAQLHQAHLIAQNRLLTGREVLSTLRSESDALRTLAAGIRHMVGL